MSRIQDILSKAERDGTARRTRALSDTALGGQAAGEPGGQQPYEQAPRIQRERTAPSAVQPAWTPPSVFVDRSAPEPEPAGYAPGVTLDARLVAATAPHSLAAEQYRSLRTRIKRAESGRPIRAIAITSPAKGDGKSLTAANLALTMAQEFQQRVLLIDADLRRPAVHRLFGITAAPGLSDVLMGAAELNDALAAVPDHHLTLLPAGPPPGHPAELLGSAAMRRVLDTLRTRFDRILIDMPPVAPLADVNVVTPLIDGVLMIVRAGVTPKPAIEKALEGLDRAKVLGLVLNEAGTHASNSYEYEGYGYIAG